MSIALDHFGDSLVRASRSLHRGQQRDADGARLRAVHRGPAAGGEHPAALAPSRLRKFLPSRGRRVVAGLLLIGVLGAAGTSLLGPRGNPRRAPQLMCGGVITESVTGQPLRDCATLWPSLFHHRAPSLVAWVSRTGGAVVVTPAEHPPAGGQWQRLPAGWTADSAVLQLHFQLEDITTGLEARRCWPARAASALVGSILRADGLGSWHVQVNTASMQGQHPNCLSVIPATRGGSDSVLLVERWTRQPADANARWPSGLAEHRRLTSTERTVNHALTAAGRCASVAQAEALWRSHARAAHIPARRYVLFTAAPGRGAVARCARVLINTPGGGGPADVYAADLP